MAVHRRIRFPGNPWPKGHALETLDWTGRIDPELGLYFDLHVRSVDYSADFNPNDDDEDLDDWRAPIVWNNYHRCTLSSTYWGQDNGVHVADEESPLDFATLDEWAWHVDDHVPVEDHDAHSFHIYLLGHDTVLRHRIHFAGGRGGTFGLKWTAKIALTYAGRTELAHSLVLESEQVTFGGFRIPEGVSAKEAQDALARFTTGPTRYTLRKGLLIPQL